MVWRNQWQHVAGRRIGALAEAILLQAENAEILQDLLVDPEPRDDLRPVPGAVTLAILRPGSAGRIRKQLKSRGMELGDKLA